MSKAPAELVTMLDRTGNALPVRAEQVPRLQALGYRLAEGSAGSDARTPATPDPAAPAPDAEAAGSDAPSPTPDPAAPAPDAEAAGSDAPSPAPDPADSEPPAKPRRRRKPASTED